MQLLPTVLAAYGINAGLFKTEIIGSGLIHRTWKICCDDEHYILQEINEHVFKDPEAISHNIKTIGSYLQLHHPHYLFVEPITALNGSTMVSIRGEGYFRLFPFVKKSHTINVVETPQQAFEAAMQFGRFTKQLNGIDIHEIKITLPFFHDLSLRYRQFVYALENGNRERIHQSNNLIQKLLGYASIVKEYQQIIHKPGFQLRVTHHDTKISNVLFDENDKGLCVIDLDTVMPGYFISDVGDMLRTYLSPVSEEETNLQIIEVRDDFYKAVADGYFAEMNDVLSATEKKYFFFAGQFMIYMQAIRFLTDYVNNDVYYAASYPLHNYNRSLNQTTLLEKLLQKEQQLQKFIK